MNIQIVIVTLLAVVVLWLAQRTWRATVTRRTNRADYFGAYLPLFDSVTSRIEPSGFPRMTGRIGPHAFDLQVIPDSLTYRKLPSLWLMVSLPEALPVSATLDIMTRATGQEPFSRFSTLPHAIVPPDFLPEGTGVRSDQAQSVLPEQLVAKHASIFSDPRVKELVISPKGLRLVIQAEEADRGKYLLFRDAEMGANPPDVARIDGIIRTLLAIRAEVAEIAAPSQIKELT